MPGQDGRDEKDHGSTHDTRDAVQRTATGDRGDGEKPGRTTDDSKGKGKANEPSWGHRLQASGNLILNAVTTAPRPLPGANAASPGKTANGTSVLAGLDTAPGEASSQRLQSAAPAETMREPRNNEASPGAYEAFMDEAPALPEVSLNHGPLPGTTSDAVAQQEARDGAAVQHLLFQPDFHEETQPPLSAYDDSTTTPEETQRLQEALFSPNNSRSSSSLADLLALVPAFEDGGAAGAQTARLYTGVDDPVGARRAWLRQWGDVLAGYTDEVWGSLDPLRRQAQREVDDGLARGDVVPDERGGPETKALMRLRQILAHVRGTM